MTTKRLYRTYGKNAVIGGVCGGIAEYYNSDPTLIRLLWILITIFSFGVGFFGYIIAWIIIPQKPKEKSSTTKKKKR